jgi:hypothetical protein
LGHFHQTLLLLAILNIPDGFSYVAKNRKIFKHKSGGIVVVYRNNLKNHIKFKYLIKFIK